MDNIMIKVSTEALRDKSVTVDGLIKNLNQQYEDLYRQIKSVSAYWKGEASVKSMEQCEKDKKLVLAVLQRLKEYPEDLREIAGIYDVGEKGAQDSTSSLPFDVIV